MAHHKSALKRIRQSQVKRVRNQYYHKSARTAVNKLKGETDKKIATEQLPKVISMVDKLVKRNIIHKNKAANIKGKLAKHVNSLA